MSSANIGSMPRSRGSWDNAPADATTIRVLTLNAHQGFSAMRRRNVLSQIRDELRADDAHWFFCRKLAVLKVRKFRRISTRCWLIKCGRSMLRAQRGNDRRPSRQRTVSKYSIVRWQNIDVSVGEAEPRGILHCVLDVPARAAPCDMRASRAA